MSFAEEKKDIKEELRQKINKIEESLDSENGKLQKINIVQDSLASLKKNLDKCTTIYTRSMEPGAAKEHFSNLLSDNEIHFKKTCGDFEEQAEILRRKVIDLQNERDVAISEYEKHECDEKNDN